jgi:hypothetical protein
MPAISFKDAALGKIYNQLAANPASTIDSSNVVSLLATIADGPAGSAAKMVTKLNAAPTREAQLKIVQDGLSKNERKDLEAILDRGTVTLAPEWKNFFDAVLGRDVLGGGGTVDPNAPLQINSDFSNGIRGTAKPGVTIEAINVTTAPGDRLHIDDTVEIATVGADGKFTGQLIGPQLVGTKTGDLIRVRTRDANGQASDWVTVRATGLGATDTRNAVVALQRIELVAEANDKISVTNNNSSRQISEPGAQLQFKNARTGQTQLVTLDNEGQFPANLKVNGKAGDNIVISASDGTNNKTFATAEGTLRVPGGSNNGGGVDLPDPKLHKNQLNADGTPKNSKVRYTGPLFINEPSPLDVAQGNIGDCYLPSAVAAVANVRPEAIKNMMKQNADGTYTVTFKERSWSGNVKDVPITIDGDLYVRSWGGPVYGATTGSNEATEMEMWWPLLEKAYAQYKGSYDAIGNGGSAGTVMSAMLGLQTSYVSLGSKSQTTQDRAWNAIKSQIDNKLPAALGTGDEEDRYRNTGIYGDHSYSVLGYKEENGKRYVKIRNPWGESEPSGNGANDGVFFMELSKVCELYDSLDLVK